MVKKVIREAFFLLVALPVIMLFIVALIAEWLIGDEYEKE